MADENIVRSYRSSGPARRATETVLTRDSARDAAAKGEESFTDPLAELARLIGQSDPFADLRQSGGRGDEAAPAARPRTDPAPAPGWRATAAALAREAMRRPAPEHAEGADPQLEKIHSAISDIDAYRGGPNEHFAQPLHSPGIHEHVPEPYGEQPYFGDCAESLPVQGHAAPGEDYFFGGESASDERFYDDATARQGNGLVTVAVLIGCALLGTAGAYAYRTYHAGARSTDTPIISADPTPNKMVPASAAVDPQSGKTGQVADAGAGEQVVTHQEEPIALPNPSAAPGVPSAPQATGIKPSAPGTASAPKDPSQPKKFRTVAIRPDNPDDLAKPLVTTPAPPAGQTLPAAPATAARPPASPKPASQPRNGGAPGEQPSTASRLASAPAAAASYVVQLSSQRSEADAQASFHSLQAKFPQQLGDREPIVRRADLGAKGIYYRALVGPFGSAGEADQFCTTLKAAGGQCLVQKN